MAETWIDTRSGDLLIGRAAAADRIDEAGPEIMPLAGLLQAEEFPFRNGDFGESDMQGWTRDDLIAFGKWTIHILASTGTDENDTSNPILTRRHIERMHIY